MNFQILAYRNETRQAFSSVVDFSDVNVPRYKRRPRNWFGQQAGVVYYKRNGGFLEDGATSES